MNVAIACDHGGFALKQAIVAEAEQLGHTVIDCGAYTFDAADDYPDFAYAVGAAIQRGEAERGILLCGSGVGASVAATKMRGLRAAVCHDAYSAHQGVEHDDMNVLCLALMLTRQIRHLPVLADDRLVGMISMLDAVRAVLSRKALVIQ